MIATFADSVVTCAIIDQNRHHRKIRNKIALINRLLSIAKKIANNTPKNIVPPQVVKNISDFEYGG